MGSVKDLEVLQQPGEDTLGVGKFTFSDRYSVFDWGEMPDHIPLKGQSLAIMGAYNFIALEERGAPSHFLSLYSEDDEVRFDPGKPSDTMYVSLTRVLPIENDYAAFRGDHSHYLIPLEIIFRNGAPKGSSLFKKFDSARGDEEAFTALLNSLGLKEEPSPGDFFPEPVYDFTTKLESTDRPVPYEEAREMAGLAEEDFQRLLDLAHTANDFITRQAESAGMQHFDGKIETMYYQGEIQLVDVLGTFDENRFLYQGEQVSKEILRQAYKAFQPDWVAETERAKQEAAAQNDSDWKSYCDLQPESLPEELITLVSQIYQAGANLYIGEEVFPAVPALGDLIPELKRQKQRLEEE